MADTKNILIAVVGTSPQVVTETLYDLMVQRKEQAFIHEIHLLSTTIGMKTIEENLLAPVHGYFYHFCADFGFVPHNIKILPKIICHFNNTPLDDIRTRAENEAAREFIIHYVAEQSRRDDVRIFASIAGGRKTMSAYLSLAMNLYGREQDTLSHVLVYPSESELGRDFFYPKPNLSKITLRNGTEFPMREVRIELAEIPFIQLRPMLQAFYQDHIYDIQTLFDISQHTINQMQANVAAAWEPRKRELRIEDGKGLFQVTFPPKEASIYHLAFKSDVPLQLHLMDSELREIYEKVKTRHYDKKREQTGWEQEDIQKKISNINTKFLPKRLPLYLVKLLALESHSNPEGVHYMIRLPKSRRKVVE